MGRRGPRKGDTAGTRALGPVRIGHAAFAAATGRKGASVSLPFKYGRRLNALFLLQILGVEAREAALRWR